MLEEGAPLCDRLPVDHGRVHKNIYIEITVIGHVRR